MKKDTSWSSQRSLQQYAYSTIGAVLVVASLLLAYQAHFRHYYEILVFGFALTMYWPTKKHISRSDYIRLYKMLIVAGIIGDLILGIGLNLWHYTFIYVHEYFLLYMFEYPVAGIVMVQAYIIAKDRLAIPARKNTIPSNIYKTTKHLFGASATLTLILLMCDIAYILSAVAFYVSISLFALSILSERSHAVKRDNLFQDIYNSPLRTLIAIFIATYTFAIIEEVSNNAVHQWVYTNETYASMQISGVPLLFIPFWPLLLLLPVGAYYYVKSREH